MTVSLAKTKLGPKLASLSLLLTAVAVACLLLAPGASHAKGKQGKPLYWGALIGPELTGTPPPWDMAAARKFTASVGKGMSMLQFAAPWADCSDRGEPCEFLGFPGLAMQSVREYGAIPFFNWASQSIPTGPSQPAFRLKKITQGKYDPFLRNFAEDAAEWGHPFFLRFDWEMNGFWYPWSPGINGNRSSSEFVAAWRHVWRIFQREGATNATWVWCPNVDFTGKLTPLNSLYPGNRFVDWTCLDGFNWGETRNSVGWQSFREIFRGTYQRVSKLAPSKPMVIGETASEERGGSKSAWIRRMLSQIPRNYPKVRGVFWFNERDQGMNWPLSSSRQATRAFRRGIANSLYRPNLYSGLPAGKIKPPTMQAPPPEAPVTPPVP